MSIVAFKLKIVQILGQEFVRKLLRPKRSFIKSIPGEEVERRGRVAAAVTTDPESGTQWRAVGQGPRAARRPVPGSRAGASVHGVVKGLGVVGRYVRSGGNTCLRLDKEFASIREKLEEEKRCRIKGCPVSLSIYDDRSSC
jgi:hypothetical protein